MDKLEAEGYVSVVGISLVQPLLNLVETLESWSAVTPNEVQTVQRENGYSLAIVILGTILLESALNRTAYVRGEKPDGPDYFGRLSTDKQLVAEVEEVYAVRNAIAHNHLWEAKFVWDENGSMKFTEPPNLREGYGDKRHWKVMDPATRKSRRLELNMFPARIWRRDAYIVLNTVAKALSTLQSMDRRYFPLTAQHFKFQGKMAKFNEALTKLTVPKDA